MRIESKPSLFPTPSPTLGARTEVIYVAAASREARAEIVVTRSEQDFAGGSLPPCGLETLSSVIEH